MLKLHHDLTSPQGETSSAEYCPSFCFGNLRYFLGTFRKLSTRRCNDSAFGALGRFIQRYPRVVPQQSWHHLRKLDAWCSVRRIWPEWFLFDFGQLMSVPVGEDRESASNPTLLHLPSEPLVSSIHHDIPSCSCPRH